MTDPAEAGAVAPVAEPPEDEELDADEDFDAIPPPQAHAPSIAPGPRRLAVPEGEVVRRVDRFVADRTGLSRSYVQKLISEGLLVDDSGRRLRANSEVRGGAVTLEVPPAEVPYHLEPDPSIEVAVVYEDDDLLIVDKPAGLVVHPAPGHWRGTLVNALLARGDHYGGIAGVARPGIVHRLDRDTSGLLIVARNDAAQAGVMAQLKARRVRKTYLALVQGQVSAAAGRIEAPIGRDPKDRKRMAVVSDGRPSVTGYRVRERFAAWTAPGSRPHHGSHPPDPGAPRRPRPSGRRRRRVRHRDLAQGSRRAGAPVPPCVAPGAGLAVVGQARAGRGAAPGLARGGPRGSARERGVGRPPTRRWRGMTDPEALLGAPGALLVIISGPSGVGKDTIIEALAARPRDPDYHYTITCTTRAPRPGETPGVSYRFLAPEAFHELRLSGELLEANEVHGNWYGTPRRDVAEALAAGHDVILKIDVQGASVVKQRVPDALLVFIVPPSLEALFQRLRSRATETADELETRQRNAAIELARQGDYDRVVVNETGEIERTAAEIEAIIEQAKRRSGDRRIRIT